jgi:hypothetical protein
MNDIPRYKASFPLQTVFVTNADACGDHVFTQVARKGNVAVYRRNDVGTGRIAGWETVVIKTVKAGTVYAKGAAPTTSDTESYPGAKSFGKHAWSYTTESAAMNKLEELVKEEVKPETVSGYIVPSQEFTFTQFAEANKLPIDKGTATIIQNLLRDKALRFLRSEPVNGRTVQYFGKA